MTKLTVNADDFGYSEGVNAGIISAHKNGIVTSTTIMSNMPAYEDGVKLLRENKYLKCGVHLTLSCYKPLLKTHKTIVDENGNFYKRINNNGVLTIIFIVYLISGIITYKNIYSILPILAATIYLYFVWNGNELKVKKAAFYRYFLWLAYNICVFSIAGIASNIVSIISTFIAIYNQKNIAKQEITLE